MGLGYTEYGLTGWKEGDAINAAITAFQSWRKYRGTGKTEDRQILQAVRDFILQHGDSRFSKLGNSTSENLHIKNRAGWWKETNIDERVYLFNAPALREAVPGFESTKILDVLQKAGWITEHDKDKRSKKTTVNGSKTNFYYIRPNEDDGL